MLTVVTRLYNGKYAVGFGVRDGAATHNYRDADLVKFLSSGNKVRGLKLQGARIVGDGLALSDLPREQLRKGRTATISNQVKNAKETAMGVPKRVKTDPQKLADNGTSMLAVLTDAAGSIQQSSYRKGFLIKGGLVLTAALLGQSRSTPVRATTDIDLDFISVDIWEKFVGDVCDILNKGSKIGANYKLVGRRGINPRFNSDSLYFEVSTRQGDIITIGLDMNVKRLYGGTEYKLAEISFAGATVDYMMTDKLSALSNKAIFRRTKDLVDVYLMAKVFTFSLRDLVELMKDKKLSVELPPVVLSAEKIHGVAGIKHAFEQQAVGKALGLTFEEVYTVAVNFSSPIYQAYAKGLTSDFKWDIDRGAWFLC